MLDYINNLIHKASESSLMLKPEPRADTVSKLFPLSSFTPEENQAIESSVDEITNQDEPNEINSFIPLNRDTKPELETYNVHPDYERKPPIKIVGNEKTNFPRQDSANEKSNRKLERSFEYPNDTAGSNAAEISDESSRAEKRRFIENDFQNKSKQESEESSYETSGKYINKKQNNNSGTTSTPEYLNDDIPGKSSNLKTGNENINFSNTPEQTLKKVAVKNDSASEPKPKDRIVNIEPVTEIKKKVFVEELINATKNRTSSKFYEKNTETDLSSAEKEINVNIRRIELKSSHKIQSKEKRSLRGFDDHIMMRLYLDRHYF